MNFDGRRIGVARFAAVLPGVRGLRRLDKEPRRGDVATLFGYHRDTAPGTVVAQNMVVVVPKDVSWWLRAEVYGARQIYRASRANVQLWTSEYRRCRYCDKNNHFLSPFPPFLPSFFPSSLPSTKSIIPPRVRVGKDRREIWFEAEETSREERESALPDLAPTNEPKLFFIESQGHRMIEITRPCFRIALSKIRFNEPPLERGRSIRIIHSDR